MLGGDASIYKMKKNNFFPIIVLINIIVLVPIARSGLFFDGYLIKLWIAEFAAGILSIYFLYQVLLNKQRIQINIPAHSLLLAYLLANVLSWFCIPLPHRYPAFITLNSLFVYILLCFFTAQISKEEKIRNLIIFFWIITACGVCIYSIWQYLHNERVIGTLGNENFLSPYIGISIPIFIGYFYKFLRFRRKISLSGTSRLKPSIQYLTKLWMPDFSLDIFIFGFLIFLLFFVTLYLTKSRGAWFGLFWSLSSFAIIGFCPKGKRLAIAIILILIVISFLYTPWGLKFFINQFEGDVRTAIWEGTLYMIFAKSLLGWGKGAYFIFYPQFRIQDYWLTKSPTDLTIHAHNEFLQILAETGIIGLGIFLLLIFTILRRGIKTVDSLNGREKYLLLGIICGIIGLLAHNLVCNNLQMPSSAIFLWIMLGLVISYMPFRNLHRGFFLALMLFMVIIIWATGIRQTISQYLFRQGAQYREKEKWDSAIGKYESAINWYPWDVEMHYRTAYAYTMNKQYDMAIKKYKDVTALAPLYGNVHRNMGIVYIKKGENKLAAEEFLKQIYVNEYDFISRVDLRKAMENYANKQF